MLQFSTFTDLSCCATAVETGQMYYGSANVECSPEVDVHMMFLRCTDLSRIQYFMIP